MYTPIHMRLSCVICHCCVSMRYIVLLFVIYPPLTTNLYTCEVFIRLRRAIAVARATKAHNMCSVQTWLVQLGDLWSSWTIPGLRDRERAREKEANEAHGIHVNRLLRGLVVLRSTNRVAVHFIDRCGVFFFVKVHQLPEQKSSSNTTRVPASIVIEAIAPNSVFIWTSHNCVLVTFEPMAMTKLRNGRLTFG